MTVRFWARGSPDAALLGALCELDPVNPFVTPAFVSYRSGTKPGTIAWALGLEEGERLLCACIGYLVRSRLPWSSSLEIHSLAVAPECSAVFWSGLRDFCERERVKSLSLQSFGSRPVSLPDFPDRVWHRHRREFVLPLMGFPGIEALATNHRRNVRRAEREGIELACSSTPEVLATHARLMDLSMERRRQRGEGVGAAATDRAARNPADLLLAEGAGEIHQAIRGDEVLSSILILRAREGAYYHSAGTSPEGMKAGASYLLVTRLCEQLRDAGLAVFNLGGADSEGLQRFKSGFGAVPVELEAAGFFTGNRVARVLEGGVRAVRRIRA